MKELNRSISILLGSLVSLILVQCNASTNAPTESKRTSKAVSAKTDEAINQKNITVGFVVDIPPFVMGEKGILVDLIREATGKMGYNLKIFHFPSRQFDEDPLTKFKELDVFIGTPLALLEGNSYSKIFEFENVAVSKKSSNLQIKRIEDLKNMQIVAFNNASVHLKEPFTTFYQRHLKDWPGYIEVENQKSQFAMLHRDRTQVILLDRYMVHYYAKLLGVQNKLVFHEIFPETNAIYAVGRDETFTKPIAEQILLLKKNGWVRKMLQNYR